MRDKNQKIILTKNQRKKEIERNEKHYMEMVRHAKINYFIYGLFVGIIFWMINTLLNDI